MSITGFRPMSEKSTSRVQTPTRARFVVLLLLAGLLIGLISPATVAALQVAPPRALTTGEVDDDTITIIEEYRIQGDIIVDNGTPIPDLHQQVWDRYAGLFPAATRPEIDLFVGIDSVASAGTDGALQVSALDDSKRYLALDVSGAVSINELTRTMIHETAHLLQFRPSSLDGGQGTPCDVYNGGEGCPKAGSYLRLWSTQFYPGVAGGDYPETPADIAARYTPDSYVTGDYAATNPAEDMAETFAEWVLLDAPTGPSFVTNDPHYASPVTGTKLVDEKLRFFDQFPELIAIRATTRASLSLDALAVAPAPVTPSAPAAPPAAPVDPGPTGDQILQMIKENEAAAAVAAAEATVEAAATSAATAAAAASGADAAPAAVMPAPAAAAPGDTSLALTGSTTDLGLALSAAFIGMGCVFGATARRRRQASRRRPDWRQ